MPGESPIHPHPWASAGLRLLRGYHEAALTFGDRRAPVRFIHDAARGDLVFPAESAVAALAADRDATCTLSLPDEPTSRLDVLGHPRVIERPELHEPCDRWCAYFGTAPPGVWISLRIDSAKSADPRPSRGMHEVYAADSLALPNPLSGPAEWRLIKRLNADPAVLAAVAAARTSIAVADPRAVGIDPAGIDLRARFGIIRLEFPPLLAPAVDASAAELAIQALLASTTATTTLPEHPRA